MDISEIICVDVVNYDLRSYSTYCNYSKKIVKLQKHFAL